MKTLLKVFGILNLSLFLSCCQSTERFSIVPAIVPKSQKTQKAEKPKPIISDVIGAVELIYLPPMKSAFHSRIDTGAETSSIDAKNVTKFERDGEKWVSFEVINRSSGEKHIFERPIVRKVRIKRIDMEEKRVKVTMPVRIGGRRFEAEFTLADREDFEYQGLIGRNILTGRYLVDTSVDYTLK